MKPVKLEWITWQPTPYNDFLFRSIAADPEIELTVHFTAAILASHPWQSQLGRGFKSRVFEKRCGVDPHVLRLAMSGRDRFFVVAGWHELSTIAVVNLLIMLRRRFAVWTDTPDESRSRSFVKARLRAFWLRRVFQHAAAVMGTGDRALDALARMGAPRAKLINFPFFVDLDAFRPDTGETSERSRPLVFLSSGRLSNELKRYDLALKALARVRDETGLEFRYRIAGTGPDEQQLRELANSLGIADRVEFTGWLEPAELPAFYRSGDIFLHPAHFDPFPNAVLEAMASGLVVIGSDKSGSVIDRIRDGENGFIHKDDDIDHLEHQIGRAAANRSSLKRVRHRARETAESWPVTRGVELVRNIARAAERTP